MTREGIYDLEIMHSRNRPVRQHFTIRGYSLYVDVARFDGNDTNEKLLGFSASRLHNFKRKDFLLLADLKNSAVGSALAYLKKSSGIAADRVFLLANPRILGYVFNPVSFFFYFKAGRHAATVVEVNNTFGQQKHFVLPARSAKARTQKDFYVSPFISPFSDFVMRITPPEESLSLGIHTHGSAGVELVAEMKGVFFPLNDRQLFRFFIKYPMHTLRIIVLIHWYALRLLIRKVPFYPKENSDAALLHAAMRSAG